MPIPDFDHITSVLPPHLGDPVVPANLSPYLCTAVELCTKFATSPARKAILRGFLKIRQELMRLGIQGFQWLDGSFLEDIELLEGRDPHDLDVVTFITDPSDMAVLTPALGPRDDLWKPARSKALFCVDHYVLPLCSPPEEVVEQTRYWYGLFSHRRDSTWKGMLRVELATITDDALAWHALGSSP